MDKIIVYGKGDFFSKIQNYIEITYDVLAICDKNKEKENVIVPSEINNYEYDFILVTSDKYFDEIKSELISLYGIDGNKIKSFTKIMGKARNQEFRDEWIQEKLKSIAEGDTILDAGAGESRYKKYCSHLKYISQDFGEYVPNESLGGLHSNKWDYSDLNIVCDIIDIPMDNETIDVIMCTEVIEHIKEPILAIKEFSRLLKPNGKLLLSAPFCCLTHMAPYFFYNGFSEYWYKEVLKECGFEVLECKKYGNWFEYLFQELNRIEHIINRYTDEQFSINDRTIVYQMMNILTKFEKSDKGSDELLCFGILIEAIKK